MDDTKDDTKDDTNDGRCALAARLDSLMRSAPMRRALDSYACAVAAGIVGQLGDERLRALRLRREWPALDYAAQANRAEGAPWDYVAQHDASVAFEALAQSLGLDDPNACCAAWDARGCPASQVCERGNAALQSLQRRAELAIAAAVDRLWEGVNA